MIGPPHPPIPHPSLWGGKDGGLGQSVPATLSPLLQTGESGGTDLPEPHPLRLTPPTPCVSPNIQGEPEPA